MCYLQNPGCAQFAGEDDRMPGGSCTIVLSNGAAHCERLETASAADRGLFLALAFSGASLRPALDDGAEIR